MSKISADNLKGMLTEHGLETCFFCNDTIEHGGCWVGITDIAVCNKDDCNNKLLDLYIDTLDDSNSNFIKLNITQKSEYINRKVLERLRHKQQINSNNSCKK